LAGRSSVVSATSKGPAGRLQQHARGGRSGAQARPDLLEILEDRYGRRSTIVTSQLPIADWHTVIGEATYADAILDRLVHNAHRLELSGESLRRSAPPSQA
jgi:DNA replication protein DnaC